MCFWSNFNWSDFVRLISLCISLKQNLFHSLALSKLNVLILNCVVFSWGMWNVQGSVLYMSTLKVRSLLSSSGMQPLIQSNVNISLFRVKTSWALSIFNFSKGSIVCELKSEKSGFKYNVSVVY